MTRLLIELDATNGTIQFKTQQGSTLPALTQEDINGSGSVYVVYFDLSVVNDRNYYDGIIFKGFVNGIPDSVLSGGRYDRLLSRMGKKCGAIGFAVYLDRLERFGNETENYDVDILLIYDADVDCKSIIDAVKQFNQSGKTVKTSATADGSVRYRRLLKISKGGIDILETND